MPAALSASCALRPNAGASPSRRCEWSGVLERPPLRAVSASQAQAGFYASRNIAERRVPGQRSPQGRPASPLVPDVRPTVTIRPNATLLSGPSNSADGFIARPQNTVRATSRFPGSRRPLTPTSVLALSDGTVTWSAGEERGVERGAAARSPNCDATLRPFRAPNHHRCGCNIGVAPIKPRRAPHRLRFCSTSGTAGRELRPAACEFGQDAPPTRAQVGTRGRAPVRSSPRWSEACPRRAIRCRRPLPGAGALHA